MKLVIRHSTLYTYPGGSTRAAMLLKLKPRDLTSQKVHEWSLTVNEEPVTTFHPNGIGELEALWVHRGWLETAEIVASGIIETTDTAGVIGGFDERFDPRIYLRDTDLTKADPAIKDMAVGERGDGDLDLLHAISARIRGAVDYRTGSTGPDTSAAESWAAGRGVCQDHAHIFISAVRSLGFPARYVTGYLLAAEAELALHETHAWAEALVPGLGWVGFDASNGVSVTENYVRLASGMDAHDAAPVRGSVFASGAMQVDADVRIDNAVGGGQVQQLQEQQQQQQTGRLTA